MLLDENLSRRIANDLRKHCEVGHVCELGLVAREDLEIWRLAREGDFVIVSKDRDFADLAILHGAPPKVVRLRLGNCSWRFPAQVLIQNWAHIKEFYADPDESLLVISAAEVNP